MDSYCLFDLLVLRHIFAEGVTFCFILQAIMLYESLELYLYLLGYRSYIGGIYVFNLVNRLINLKRLIGYVHISCQPAGCFNFSWPAFFEDWSRLVD